ncbi:MAG: ATP-binding protein [Candidatus Riflebacteria bacterium]|nr:ATP-binding protein [Candidatus Riflebacteria bacterium]
MSLVDVVSPVEECGVSLSAERIAVHMRIPAERLYVGNALITLREICEHLDVGALKTNRIVLALEEALLNAMEHAYLGGSGVVDLQFSVEGTEFTVIVEDYGAGMDTQKKLMDDKPTYDEILCDRGRGLLILHGVSDKACLNSDNGRGTRATMLFYLSDSDR